MATKVRDHATSKIVNGVKKWTSLDNTGKELQEFNSLAELCDHLHNAIKNGIAETIKDDMVVTIDNVLPETVLTPEIPGKINYTEDAIPVEK